MIKNQFSVVLGICLLVFVYSISSLAEISTLKTSSLNGWKNFTDLYSEEVGLSRAETISSFVQLRGGWVKNSQLETYAVMRLGTDTRTVFNSSDAVYNDNYVFIGPGVDYLGLAPGLRLSAQVGGSIDLSSKIQRGGFDFRTGFMTYHELKFQPSPLSMEFYSDGFYIQRYRNILISAQARLFYELFKFQISQTQDGKGKGFIELSPMLSLVSSLDTEGLDYNRFVEARFGLRIRTGEPISILLSPYFAYGSRYQYPSALPNYTDFRILLAFYKAF